MYPKGLVVPAGGRAGEAEVRWELPQVALREGKGVLANFHGVNTPTMAGCKL